ncbi:phosphonate metabolism protein/1,5-bisphosphokinase (PRPP-forming) PhnN [Pseudomonas sp. 148P]|uniref:Ribose 1,5-bisphosphate phosphokinase PhnN n=1 Tax=Pseudomonas ulcerans TaxID=3115852 RepID=A0ABU7I1E6_9PSED|nr:MULTISPECIES: phosphonate metabolism protein/1,5-bisphosphokinase (PRPP-forming) PhnN [unclassified Pseudomonas]MEE1926318.1 phosphonate metabolism protein/1,5-bisphosphokinase (PRPP-forming) PhnN [Pseudomonas sp. 147P]MEE1937571.1 phosphonate metabolism protein/1,5-bisphosphokinase (PRPP-forming) PhnN [Pseudomonas sp. 148P]
MQHDASAEHPSYTRGRLIYLMGPSGSGKDSVIDQVRPALRNLGVAVARRVITRSAESVGEDAHGVSVEQFALLRAQGAFALDWPANGLHYGIPLEIDAWLAQGKWVLINGSRGHLEVTRARYPDLVPILLDVAPEVLRARLMRRGRENAEEIEQRLARNQQVSARIGEDVRHLDNSTSLEEAAQRLLELLHEAGLPLQNE